MQLLLERHRAALLANGALSAKGEDIDPCPVVKLFTPPRPFHTLTRAEPLAAPPNAGLSWQLTELDPDELDIAFGLCGLGLGCLELGIMGRRDPRKCTILSSPVTIRLRSVINGRATMTGGH